MSNNSPVPQFTGESTKDEARLPDEGWIVRGAGHGSELRKSRASRPITKRKSRFQQTRDMSLTASRLNEDRLFSHGAGD